MIFSDKPGEMANLQGNLTPRGNSTPGGVLVQHLETHPKAFHEEKFYNTNYF